MQGAADKSLQKCCLSHGSSFKDIQPKLLSGFTNTNRLTIKKRIEAEEAAAANGGDGNVIGGGGGWYFNE